MNEIVEMIDDAVVLYDLPAVFLSGGIDSAIILHHLRQKAVGVIRTYTAIFGIEPDEGEQAAMLAEKYETVHTEVKIDGFLEVLVKSQMAFERARYNVWPWFLFEAAKEDGCKNVYIGEGGDEQFGGYSDRDYLHGWAGQLEWVRPTFNQIAAHFDMDLHVPLADLDPGEMGKYYIPSFKRALRTSYTGLLPDEIIFQAGQPPAMIQYEIFWKKEMKGRMETEPQSLAEVKERLQLIAEAARTQLLAGMEIKRIVKEVLGE